MANILRIRRRAAGGGAGAPATLENAELAYNEQSNILYYGSGTGGAGGSATTVVAIGGSGAFASLTLNCTIDGVYTFTQSPIVPTATFGTNTNAAASTAFVQAAIAAASIPDGDKGDITVSGNGANWNIDTAAVTNAKLATVATGTMKGRAAAGSGEVEDLTVAEVRDLLGLAGLYQPLHASLTSIAGLTTAANQGIYTTGADTYATYTLTPFARQILDDANAAAVRTTIGAGVGSVTSVGMSVPTGFSVTGSPITGSGTLALSYATGYRGFTVAEGNAIAALPTTYVAKTEVGVANGVAPLDADTKIPAAFLPSIAITDTFVVASQAAMLALDAQVGDVAVRTDISTTYILRAEPATTLSNWQELVSPTDGVTSVNASGGTTGLTFSGGPITSSGTLTMSGTLAVANGGTGATTQGGARTNLGLGTIAVQNSNNVSITGGTIDNIVLDGGTF